MNSIFKLTSWLSVVLFFATSSMAQQYAVSKIPAELLVNANSVARYDFVHIQILSPKKMIKNVKYTVTLLNEKSNGADHSISYDKYSKIVKYQAKVFDANGKLVKTYKKGDAKDESAVSGGTLYADDRIKYFAINYAKYPFTIEYQYEVKYSGVYSYPYVYFAGFYVSNEAAFFSVSIPKDMSFRYRTQNIEVEPSITEANDVKKYTWTAKNIPAKVYEKYMPHSYEVLPMLWLAPDDIEVEKYKGSLVNWKSYGAFMHKLNKGRDNISSSLEAKIKTLTAKAASDREKIDILYKYLQNNNRYVSVQLGIGGWQTYDAKYVEKNKFGDCKALSNFMKSMLKSIGIKAHLVVVYGGEDNRPPLPKDFSTPYFANHMILYVPEEDIWLECTSKKSPVNYLGAFTEDRDVLVITEEGGYIGRTPSIPLEENSTTNQTEIVLKASGEAILKNTEITKGPQQDAYRGYFSEAAQSELEEWFHKDQDLPSFKINELNLAVKEDQPKAKLSYDVTVPRYASKAGRRLFVPINSVNIFSKALPQDDNRIYPIKINYGGVGFKNEDLITLEVPEAYEVESIPQEEVKLESDYGTYLVNITQEGNKVIYKRQLQLKSVDLPAEKYNELRDFYNAIIKADKMKLVLVKKKT